MMQTPWAKITNEAVRVLAQHGRVATVNIGQRVICAETGTTGHGVTETSKEKARTEIAALWNYVKELINDEESRNP